MKKRLILAAALSICILFSVSVHPAHAAQSWYESCVVGGVGTQGGIGLIYITNGGTGGLPPGWYSMGTNQAEANQSIATALSALSTGALVTLLVDPADGNFWPIIYGILAVRTQ